MHGNRTANDRQRTAQLQVRAVEGLQDAAVDRGMVAQVTSMRAVVDSGRVPVSTDALACLKKHPYLAIFYVITIK